MDSTRPLELALVRDLAKSGRAREIRHAAHLSLSEVATAMEVSPSEVSRWERGLNSPRGELALRYGSLLGELIRLGLPPDGDTERGE